MVTSVRSKLIALMDAEDAVPPQLAVIGERLRAAKDGVDSKLVETVLAMREAINKTAARVHALVEKEEARVDAADPLNQANRSGLEAELRQLGSTIGEYKHRSVESLADLGHYMARLSEESKKQFK